MTSGASDKKSDRALRGVVRGDGSIWSFFSTSVASEQDPPSLHRELLIEPFSSCIGDDGTVKKCRLSDTDDWGTATSIIQSQLQRFGGPSVRQSGTERGVQIAPDVFVYAKKKVVCSRQGTYKPSSSSSSSSKSSSSSLSSTSTSSSTANLPKKHRHTTEKVSR